MAQKKLVTLRETKPVAFQAAPSWMPPPGAVDALITTGQCELAYDGPFQVEVLLRYLGRDPENLAEQVSGRSYRRFVPAGGGQVPVRLEFLAQSCRVGVPPGLAAEAAREALERVAALCGLGQPLKEFYAGVAGHPVLGPLAASLDGVRMPQVPSLWEALCWAVIGQQINLTFAYRLRNAFIALGNGCVEVTGELLPFPTPKQVLGIPGEAWRKALFSRQKHEYLLGLAEAFNSGELEEKSLAALPPDAAAARLLERRGLGPWSVGYALLRGLGHLDALPVGDAGLKGALHRFFSLPEPPGPVEQERLMEPFRPWRGLATYYLWQALGQARGG